VKCVVTGGNGFIGKYVCSSLIARGHHVVVYDNRPDQLCSHAQASEFVYGDIGDFSTLTGIFNDAACVFHLSGVLGTSELFAAPQNAIETNILGALNVILAVKNAASRPRLFLPTKPNHWDNIYSVTSQAVEKLGLSYRLHEQLDIRILRIHNVYGPGQRITPVRKAVPMFICQALENVDLEIFGDGSQLVNLIYVRDLGEVIVDYVLKDNIDTAIYEIQSGISLKIVSLAQKIIEMTDSISALVYMSARLGENGNDSVTPTKDVQQLLGPLAFTKLDEALRETVDMYRMLTAEHRRMELAFYKQDIRQ
jgi:UDP-glucose 4-epimerase